MSYQLFFDPAATKQEQQNLLLKQIESLLDAESNLVANLANVTAVIKESFQPLWVGFYLFEEDQLILGPFQGPLACTRIAIGKGVCGTAAQNQKSIIVPNVDEFPGHIACSSDSRSELVVPIYDENKLYGVIDVDSSELDHFDEDDQRFYESLAKILIEKCFQ